ncbi:hypothetical protein UFVDC4_00201 [Staphylococcus phage vB_SauM-UFV_DC4]|nr:hypothetical protein UFVDC4_00201 [Staphylococcus phage vB_SauM-UFV_DC4]
MENNYYAVAQFQNQREFKGKEYIYKVPEYLLTKENSYFHKYALVSNLNLNEVNLNDDGVHKDDLEKFASSVKVVKVLKIMNEEEFIQSEYVNSAEDLNQRINREGESFEYKNIVSFFDNELKTHIDYISESNRKEKLEKLMKIRMEKLNKEKDLKERVSEYNDKELDKLFIEYKKL